MESTIRNTTTAAMPAEEIAFYEWLRKRVNEVAALVSKSPFIGRDPQVMSAYNHLQKAAATLERAMGEKASIDASTSDDRGGA